MKKKNPGLKQKIIKDGKRLEKKHYRIVIALMIFFCAYYFFLTPVTIGQDYRYYIFIFLLPTISGVILLGISRRKILLNRFSTNKGPKLWILMTFIYLSQGVVVSYISFGQLAQIGLDYCNYNAAKNNVEEILTCDIRAFWGNRHPAILFNLNGRKESLGVAYSDIKIYKDKDPANYQLKVNVVKGIWSYYIVKGWTIEHR